MGNLIKGAGAVLALILSKIINDKAVKLGDKYNENHPKKRKS